MVTLEVSVPAHSPLMKSAREDLAEAMKEVTMNRPVQWSMGIAALSERGVENWVQVSPGNNLVGLLRDVQGESQAWCTDNVDVKETVARVNRQG